MFSGRKELTLGAAIKEMLKENGIADKFDETHLLSEWDQIVGPIISQHTVSKRIDKSILFVKLDSASLRHELSYARDKLKIQLNKVVGKEVIKDIVFS
ncbi:MAG: DUF721 domain-containing protein [Bacteroidales bacterium]|nr:DUF721 domain-containing protein [Bacteroidales bacterium]